MNKILLVGNANTGKTTVYNELTKSDEHVGNWHGVTVDVKLKETMFLNRRIEVVDLPGIYSLTPLSFEESVSTNYIFDNKNCSILNVCDGNNLQRNLYLTLELLEYNLDVFLLINYIGNNKQKYQQINTEKLSKILNINVINYNPKNRQNKNNIFNIIFNNNIYQEKINKSAETSNKYHIYLKNKIPQLNSIIDIIKNNTEKKNLSSLFCAIKIFENDKEIYDKLELNNQQKKLINKHLKNDGLEIVSSLRFKYIEMVINECCVRSKKCAYGESKLDKIFLNKFFCLPIFILIFILVFYLTFFSFGAYLTDILQNLITQFGLNFSSFLHDNLPSIWLADLLDIAVVKGLGSLLCFLPQIAILFSFLNLLENSGYLSRIAFMFEDIFQKVGLSGKSVYTLLMGFGCSTTALITARNMEDKNAKIKTAMLAPYMSCSAKLPIYTVIGSMFFGASNIFVIVSLYFLGVFVALMLSLFWNKKILKSKQQSFILEFPPYRIPNFKKSFSMLWKNIKDFLIRVGSVIVCVNVIVWLLQSFSFNFTYVPHGENSILEVVAKFISPIFIPLGFGTWIATASLMCGFIAKEVVISSLVIFGGLSSFTPISAISFLVFCLLYSPCLASVVVMKEEIGKKWTSVAVLTQLLVGYVCSFVVYNFCHMFVNYGIVKTLCGLLCLFLVMLSAIVLLKKIKNGKMCGSCSFCNKKCKQKVNKF